MTLMIANYDQAGEPSRNPIDQAHRRVLIWERDAGGHRPSFVSYLVDSVRKSGDSPEVLTVARAARDERWNSIVPSEFVVVEPAALSARAAIWRAARTGAVLVVPDADANVWQILIYGMTRGRPPLRLLLLRPRAQTGLKSHLKFGLKVLGILLIRFAWGSRATVFALVADVSDNPALSRMRLVQKISDPAPISPARSEHVKPQSATTAGYWLVLGEISKRKCIFEVLQAFERMPTLRLCIVGKIVDESRVTLQEAAKRGDICLVDRAQSESEFADWISGAEGVVVLHKNRGSSGVLQHARRAGRLLVTSTNTWPGPSPDANMAVLPRKFSTRDIVDAVNSLKNHDRLSEISEMQTPEQFAAAFIGYNRENHKHG